MSLKKLVILTFGLISTLVIAATTPNVSQEEVITLLTDKADVLILDVRSKEEYNEGHIKGAVNISHDDIIEKLHKIAAFQEKKIIVYCRSGRRAGIAEEILRENGFSNVHHLTGDMNAWQAAKLPTERK